MDGTPIPVSAKSTAMKVGFLRSHGIPVADDQRQNNSIAVRI
jgi:hypothetical protein